MGKKEIGGGEPNINKNKTHKRASKILYTHFLISFPRSMFWASLIAQLVKNPPAMQETPVRFLGWEDPPEKG